MLRISTILAGRSITIKLEGKLLLAWCDELRLVAATARATGLQVQLDLEHASFLDESGAQAIRALLTDGVRIVRCSNYVAELLSKEHV